MRGIRLFTSGRITSSRFLFSRLNNDRTKFFDLPGFCLLSDPVQVQTKSESNKKNTASSTVNSIASPCNHK